MSMMERIIYWIAIVVLILSLIGLKVQMSHLEQAAQQTVQTQSSEE